MILTNDIILLQTPMNLPCWWWWLFSLGAFLLGWLLHWLLFGRSKDRTIHQLTEEKEGYHAKYVNMEKDFMSLKYQFDEQQKEYAALRNSLQRCEADKAVLQTKLDRALHAAEGQDTAGAAALGFAAGAATKGSEGGGATDYIAILGADNLQIVEGIGPKVEQLLKAEGIATWAALAAASVDRLKEILSGAGSNFRLANPDTWPRQAQLASEGKWAELIEYQKFLDAGDDASGDMETPSKVEKMVVKALGFSNNPEDLKVVEGIGPKIEQLLKDAGIQTWSDLAAASTERLQEILAAAGDRYRLADPSTWAKQAGLAQAGNWSELSAYQEFLDGGKEPEA
jgi:predicted flap endonuclease-1-like 5' DNA nuclease